MRLMFKTAAIISILSPITESINNEKQHTAERCDFLRFVRHFQRDIQTAQAYYDGSRSKAHDIFSICDDIPSFYDQKPIITKNQITQFTIDEYIGDVIYTFKHTSNGNDSDTSVNCSKYRDIPSDIISIIDSFIEREWLDRHSAKTLACCARVYRKIDKASYKYRGYYNPENWGSQFSNLFTELIDGAKQNKYSFHFHQFLICSICQANIITDVFESWIKSMNTEVKKKFLCLVAKGSYIYMLHNYHPWKALPTPQLLYLDKVLNILKIKKWRIESFWSQDLNFSAAEYNPFARFPMPLINTECGLPRYIKLIGKFCKTIKLTTYNVFVLRTKDSVILLPTITDQLGNNLIVADILFYKAYYLFYKKNGAFCTTYTTPNSTIVSQDFYAILKLSSRAIIEVLKLFLSRYTTIQQESKYIRDKFAIVIPCNNSCIPLHFSIST